MPEPDLPPEPLLALPVEPVRRGRPVLAWIAIVLLVVLMVGMQMAPAPSAAPETGDQAALVLVQLQGRLLVGAAALEGKEQSKELFAQAESLNHGPLDQRLRFLVLAGELAGPQEAQKQLRELNEKLAANHVHPTPEETELLDILGRLYDDYAQGRMEAPTVHQDAHAEELLKEELGWFGELALAPAGGPSPVARKVVLRPAERAAIVFIAGIVALAGLALLGLAGLIMLLVAGLSGQARGIGAGSSSHGAIYAETFALWLFLFIGLRLGASFLDVPESSHLLVSGVVALLSLVALAWPVLRGIAWQQVRREIGLTGGRLGILEPAVGVWGYAMALPLAAIGVLMTVFLLFLLGGVRGSVSPGDDFGPTGLPVHPILRNMSEPDWWDRLQILLLASVVAPIVEETMFRGVLYRHLRETSARFGLVTSFLVSALVSSFIFAVIHPQGLAAVPALLSLAFAFALVREWRVTLVPSMVAHGINNGLLMTALFLAAG
jgi:membrane protease YdiL (CAAX protease family)